MANPVVHFEVVGKDATTLTKFYGGAFGWQLEDVMEGSYYMANTGGEGDIPGGIGASPDGGSGHVMFYVQVDDVAATITRAQDAGATLLLPAVDTGAIEFAHLADPQGNRFGIWRPKTPEP